MARKRTSAVTFGLSFLDIMSCGFGAVILLFLIIKHNVSATIPELISAPEASSEVMLLEREILEGRKNLAELRNTIAEIDNRIVIAQGLARKITEDLNDTSGQREALAASAQDSDIQQLMQDLKRMEEERQRQEADTRFTGLDTRSFVGEGNRQYLTGMRLGGNRILVLLDASASMLDDTIINIIRRRNMSDEVKRSSPKWQRSIRMIEWLSTRFPVTSKFQIYTFNTSADAVIANTKGQWLDVSNKSQLDQAITALRNIIPAGGTSLENVFLDISQLSPLPDNIYLLTDGLPTQGRTAPRDSTISGRARLDLFDTAIRRIPANIPVNVILLPMEGDPMAGGAFWRLAQVSQGSFMTPSEDWP